MRLAETIASWFGRVEVVLAGVDGALREGEEALARGEPMRARQAAKTILARVPGSPLGLALLADACEAARLDAELAATLEELAARVASRGEIWVRLGRARERIGTGTPDDDTREAFLRALAVAEPGSEARRDALLWLTDLDLAHGDGVRAELWLERLVHREHKDVLLRRAEARLLQNDAEGAAAFLAELPPDPADGRAALVRGRTLAKKNDPEAFLWLIRARVLEVSGASEALSSALTWLPSDDVIRGKIRAIVEAQGEQNLTRWQAAFARAEGRHHDARAALVRAVRAGAVESIEALIESAIEDRDDAALQVALTALATSAANAKTPLAETLLIRDAQLVRDAECLPNSARLRDRGEVPSILDALAAIETERAKPWADAARKTALESWLPATGAPSDWPALLTRLDTHARALHAPTEISHVASLAVLRARPVCVAIVGEFNAGKSTFINAIMGADVAPTGILPTTATLHHLRYAPNSYARIRFQNGAEKERIVPSSELRQTLQGLDVSFVVDRVEILMPLASLTRVEIIDTPGFNAPDPRHAESARASLEEADMAIWLIDATQPLKQSEKRVLEEAKRAKIPVQILVNKADRLKPDEQATVMASMSRSLDETGLTSWSPPLAFSAKLALQGLLQNGEERPDAHAYTGSGWADIESLFETQIVGRSEELKERGLRRRAARVVGQLIRMAQRKAQGERALLEAVRARKHELALRAAKLEREADEAAQVVAGALRTAAAEWQRDLDVVVTGRDETRVEADAILTRYRIDRAVARLAPPLAKVLASMAGGEEIQGLGEADLRPCVRAVVRTFAATGGRSDTLVPLTRSAVTSLVEHVIELAAAPPERSATEGLVTELEALAAALA